LSSTGSGTVTTSDFEGNLLSSIDIGSTPVFRVYRHRNTVYCGAADDTVSVVQADGRVLAAEGMTTFNVGRAFVMSGEVRLCD